MELWYSQMKYNLVPWNFMEYSMEFHGTLVPPNEISLSSTEFHGTLRLSFYSIPCYPALPWETLWNSRELWYCHFNQYHVTLDLHGICLGIRWKSWVAKKNHQIPWDSMELGGPHFKWHVFHGIPWNSMEYSMEFHGTMAPPNAIPLSSLKFHGTLRLSFYSILCYPAHPWEIPWNSMELWSRQIRKSPSSWRLHGIRKAPFQMTQVFHGIPWKFPWNSMELWCRQMKSHLVPWNSIEQWYCHFNQYHVTLDLHGIFLGIQWQSWVAKKHQIPWDSMELGGPHFKWHKYSMEFHGIFHGIPWNSGAAKWNII